MEQKLESRSTGEIKTYNDWIKTYEQSADGLNADLQPGEELHTAAELLNRDIDDGDLVEVE